MNEMFEKSIHTLELPRVLGLLREQCVSDAAKRRALEIVPQTDRDDVLRLQEETEAARSMIGVQGHPPFGVMKPVAESLSRADRGGMLNTRELLDIAAMLTSARRVKEYFNEDGKNPTVLDKMFYSLHGNKYLEEKINRSILDEDTISDMASPELGDIRRHMRVVSSKSRQILQKIISSTSYSRVLQEALITQRDGRFVVPVKAEHRSELPGLVHDISSSGATIFVEPMAVVQANNELKELEAKEKKEIDRILRVLSAECASFQNDILWDYDVLVHLDLIFAKGQLSFKMDACRPVIGKSGNVVLKKARHPLLDAGKAVPIDIELGREFDTLIITGPNTGGKTVSLKTLGLLILMTQCGLQIPAFDGSEVSIFAGVLADIGDEQSIEQNLSTFSAHMVNIVRILEEADEESLVLFDELGAGTDPVEGAALAIAIIQHVRDKGARIAATTHYAELKTFAMTTPGVENASCEFDVETLRPTYKLLIGIPGKSNAFAISQRLGLDMAVIETAKAQMDAESIRFEDVLTQLESKRQTLEKEQQKAEQLMVQREADARKAREFREQMERAKENARSKGEKEARRIVEEARAAADLVFEQLKEIQKQQSRQHNAQMMNDAKAAVRRQLNEAEDALGRQELEPMPAPSRPIQEGDMVELRGVKMPASVVNVNKDGTLLLKAGNMKMTVKCEEVRLIEGGEGLAKKKNADYMKKSSQQLNMRRASTEVDLRGMMSDEAEIVVENYLDSAYVSKLGTVTIIHGKGTGALRKAVHALLKRHPHVKKFRLGQYGEGESGVTIVELK